MLEPHFVQAYAESGHAASVSLSSFIHHPCCVWNALFPCCLPSQLAFTFFLPHLLRYSLSPKRRDLMKKSPLSLNVPSFLTLCRFSSCESLLKFPSTTEGVYMRHLHTNAVECHLMSLYFCVPLANSNFHFSICP